MIMHICERTGEPRAYPTLRVEMRVDNDRSDERQCLVQHRRWSMMDSYFDATSVNRLGNPREAIGLLVLIDKIVASAIGAFRGDWVNSALDKTLAGSILTDAVCV